MKTRMGVVRAGWGESCPALWNASVASTNRGEVGGRIPSSNKFPARASAPQRALARISRNRRHLGVSSPSGNARGGWPRVHPFGHWTMTLAKKSRVPRIYDDHFFLRRSPPPSLHSVRPFDLPPRQTSDTEKDPHSADLFLIV